MSYITYVDHLNAKYRRAGFPPYRWSTFGTSPWISLGRPLRKSRIALVSSAGVFRKDQKPFDPWAVNDLSFRVIPKNTPVEKLRLHHNYFDHRDALKDLNCVFPIERIQELENAGRIGQVAPVTITLGMGRLYKRKALQRETVPRIWEVLRKQKTDAALLVAV